MTAPPLSYEQLNLRATRLVKGSASALGIMIGCIIGMCPLLFYDDRKAVYFDDDEMNLFQLQFAPYGVTQQQYFAAEEWHVAGGRGRDGPRRARPALRQGDTFTLGSGRWRNEWEARVRV